MALQKIFHRITIPFSLSGQRIDKVLSILFPDYSRSLLSQWLKQKAITVDGEYLLPKAKAVGGEVIVIDAVPMREENWQPQPIDISLAYQDDELLIVNKPAGLVVHPAAGNPDSTLVNALLYHDPSLEQLPRAGIIHRLDKDTTGLLLVAKNLKAYTQLIAMMQQRQIKRHYTALCHGYLDKGTIDAPIARHPKNRLKMAIVSQGKPAVTHYSTIKNYTDYSLVNVELETGRTHQIRVHMAHLKHALVGDPLYGYSNRFPSQVPPELLDALTRFNRQALHARQLKFIHPITKQEVVTQAPLPQDLTDLIQLLDQYHE